MFYMALRKALLPRITLMVCLTAIITWAGPVEIQTGKDRIEVKVDGKPFTTYYFGAATAKPYLMPLRTASGVIVTRGFPVGNDASAGDPKSSAFEPHQRPLYFAHGDIDGLDFWSEAVFAHYYDDHNRQAYGHMVLDKIEDPANGQDSGSIRARFHLEDPNNRVIADETQKFTFGGGEGIRTVDCEFVIEATHGPVVMGDTKEGTFGIRLAQELSAPHDRMTNSEGARGEQQIWGRPADWVSYAGAIGGKAAGIAVFDHPKSFRHPTTWHARAYGLFAANPFGLREFSNDPHKDGSWTIPEGKSLTFRYEVLIYDGEMSSSRIEAAYRKYASGN